MRALDDPENRYMSAVSKVRSASGALLASGSVTELWSDQTHDLWSDGTCGLTNYPRSV